MVILSVMIFFFSKNIHFKHFLDCFQNVNTLQEAKQLLIDQKLQLQSEKSELETTISNVSFIVVITIVV